MPTQGSNIPVLSVEKFWLDNDGRGINVYNDGSNFWSGASISELYASSISTGKYQILPAASTSGWLRIRAMSGSTGSLQTGYIPIFSCRC